MVTLAPASSSGGRKTRGTGDFYSENWRAGGELALTGERVRVGADGRSGLEQASPMFAQPPIRSYVIWFSQRVGSTLLTQALEDTGIAGRPREWLNVAGGDLLGHYQVGTSLELRDRLWREARTDNGVIGVK